MFTITLKEREVYSTSFIHVWTTFENQVQDLYASQRVPIFSSLRKPEAHFWYNQGHQRAGAFFGLHYKKNNNCDEQCSTSKVSEHWKKTFNPINWFPEIIKEVFHHYLQKKQARSHLNKPSKVMMHLKNASVVIKKSYGSWKRGFKCNFWLLNRNVSQSKISKCKINGNWILLTKYTMSKPTFTNCW